MDEVNIPKKGKLPSFDGTKIFYEATGSGGLTFIPCNGVGVSTFFWKYIADYFSKNNRVILWDYRSHGKSDAAPDLHDLTMTNNARDLKAVMDYNKVDKAVLLGHSMGCQTIFEFYSLFPERVAALIPMLGPYEKPMNTFLNTDKTKYVFPILHFAAFAFPWVINPVVKKLVKSPISFPVAKMTGLINWQHCKYEELEPYLEHLSSLDMRAFFGMAKRMQEHSAKEILSRIKVPTLIIAGEDDIFTPWRISEEMCNTIPDSELLTIPHGSHAAIVEQPELINLRIEKFLYERVLCKK
ncbi:MAG: alpha/beta hydrolase [Desulfobacterales bacterium]|nr:alpha/beta hydrolase [Desulfobacterales bacterium]MBF0396342.1 alpha/beta hydrolase [Desulfobacterales bacterium]